MARGTPDWGTVPTSTGFILLEDLAELAARLGSPTVEDRSGKVFWLDEFRHGLESWLITPGGPLSEAITVSTTPKIPPYCCKLVAGSGGLRNITFEKHFGIVPSGGIGAEISIMFPGTYTDFDWTIAYGNGTITYIGRLWLSQATGLLRYQDFEGEYPTIVANVDLDNDADEYHTLKLVVDFATNKYVRCMLSGVRYDLSGIDLYSDTPGDYKALWVNFRFYGNSSQNDACFLDAAIMTKDEI